MKKTGSGYGRTGLPVEATDVILGALIALFGSGAWTLLTAASTVDDDPFDSPWYWPSWAGLCLVALGVALLRPVWPRPLWWAAALVLPSALMLAVQGTVLHNPADGASLWMAGEVFVMIQGGFVLGAASLGSLIRCRWSASGSSDKR